MEQAEKTVTACVAASAFSGRRGPAAAEGALQCGGMGRFYRAAAARSQPFSSHSIFKLK